MNVENIVLALEAKRCKALLEADPVALSALLSERLRFTHANAQCDTRQTLLEKFRSGNITYESLDVSEAHVVAFDDCALLFSHLIATVRVSGAQKRIDNQTLSVWALEDGQFRLIAYQPTAVAQG